jgi:hypothetical protein
LIATTASCLLIQKAVHIYKVLKWITPVTDSMKDLNLTTLTKEIGVGVVKVLEYDINL